MSKEKQESEVLTLPKGLTITVGGMPFNLVQDTKVIGNKNNLELVKKHYSSK